VDFLNQRGHVDHRSVAHDGQATLVENAGRDQVQLELLSTDDHRVAGIAPALVSDHSIRVFREDVGDLALALIAPLGAHNDLDCHATQLLGLIRARKRPRWSPLGRSTQNRGIGVP